MKLLFLAIVLLQALLVHGRSSWYKNVEWDVLIFTQQWPITSCISHLSHNPHSSCNIFPNMTSWTVHGIWPTKLGTIGPNYCNKTWHFHEAEIMPIEKYLIKYWGNIFAEDPMTSLWQHEWVKHGTCAAQLPSLNSEEKYFGKGLDWVTHYDYVAVLGHANIYPDDVNAYTREQIFTAIKDMFGVNPHVDCIYNKKTKVHELYQIKICFDHSLHVVDCDGIKDKELAENQGSCPKDGIIYPASVKAAGKEYSYPRALVDLHKKYWDESQATCVTWMCHALMTIFSLIWITL
ncbi:ribonuclease Oy [Macrobrachium rosenbergii]|uniref:ribonuclease Oy n=1 Tax=Macrobrachium rosenbergii TaxID=79674 RepID=UPI0034D657FF